MRLTVEYDGTDFCGLQWQPHVRTVGGVLETALTQLFSEPVKVSSAGRTDAGVHACGQVVSFSTACNFPFDRLRAALNGTLPRDVAVRDATIVHDGFSARFDAVERAYVFALLADRDPSPLCARYVYRVWRPLDVDAMRAATAFLMGEHDFRSFCATPPENGVTVRTVRRLDVERRGDLVRVAIAADGFLHRMVRTIVGTLVECANGLRSPAELPAILDACDRRAAGHTAPPQGLFLAGVRYADGYDSFCDPPIFRWGAP